MPVRDTEDKKSGSSLFYDSFITIFSERNDKRSIYQKNTEPIKEPET